MFCKTKILWENLLKMFFYPIISQFNNLIFIFFVLFKFNNKCTDSFKQYQFPNALYII